MKERNNNGLKRNSNDVIEISNIGCGWIWMKNDEDKVSEIECEE